MGRRLLTALLLAFTILGSGRAARAQEAPPDKRALLVLRVVLYDRKVEARAGGVVRVAVLYPPGDRACEALRDALLGSFARIGREMSAGGLPIAGVAIAWTDGADLDGRLHDQHVSALYVCDALAPRAAEVARVTRKNAVLSFTGSRRALDAGLAIGLVDRGPRTALVVNLDAARAEGSDLAPALLSVAEVIR